MTQSLLQGCFTSSPLSPNLLTFISLPVCRGVTAAAINPALRFGVRVKKSNMDETLCCCTLTSKEEGGEGKGVGGNPQL